MLFASTELAARIEHAERQMLVDIATAVQRDEPERDLLCIPLAGGVATYLGTGSPMTKVAGAGFGEALDVTALGEIEEGWRTRGAPVQVELSTLADPGAGLELTRRGYELRAFENVLAYDLRSAATSVQRAPADAALAIERCAEGDFERWMDISITGFASADEQGNASHESFPRDAIDRAIRDVSRTSGFSRYIARWDGEPVATASMHIDGGIAQLCGAATLPSHRRRGIHSAMFRARLDEACRCGCDVAVVATLPGSKSQENAQKRGFELLYTRAILVWNPA